MMRKPAEVFPPGSFVAEELEARGLDKYLSVTDEFREGKVALDRASALALALMLGTSRQFWLNLQRAWDERKERESDEQG